MVQVYGYVYISSNDLDQEKLPVSGATSEGTSRFPKQVQALDIFKRMEKTEWDTLLFFYGVIMCVGGLGFLGKVWTCDFSLCVASTLDARKYSKSGRLCRPSHDSLEY